MNTTASLDQMQQLKLLGMHHAYHSQLELPMNQQLEGHELIAHLLGAEQLHRVNEKTTYYLKLAKLRLPATLEQIECSPARNLTKQQLAVLAEGRYLDQGEKLLITGATGCGKKLPGLRAAPSGLYPGIQNQLLKHIPVDRKSDALPARWFIHQNT